MEILRGEFIAITGASGSGKSTLLNVMGLLDSFDKGSYRIDNIDVSHLRDKDAARFRNNKIGFVFQAYHLLDIKNIRENVELPLLYQGVAKKSRQRRALELLEMVGLGDRAESMPKQLSGGQKQRVAIARSLVTHPCVVFADEPTGALDSNTTEDIMAVFKSIHAMGNTLVMVTHDQSIAEQAGRVIRVADGLIENALELNTESAA